MEFINAPEATYRKSKVSEALDAFKTVSDASVNQQNATSNRMDAESRKSMLELELAKMNQTKMNEDFNNGYKLLTDISNRADTFADDTSKAMWEQSDGYHELTKIIKKTLGPEFVNADGKINYIGKQTRVEDQLKRIEGQLGERIKQVGLEGLTQQEKDLVKYFKNPGTEAIAKVYTAILEDPEFQVAQSSGDANKMAQIVQNYRKQIFPDEGLRGAPTSTVDATDPLGWRKRSA